MIETPNKLVCTLAPINSIVGDVRGNTEKIRDVWHTHDAHSDLIVFPELALSGYPPEDLVLKPAFLDRIKDAIRDLVEKSKGFSSAVLIGCPWHDGAVVYNAVHLIEDGHLKATQYKHHLPNYGVFDEKRIFSSGPLPCPITFRGVNLGVMICEDMWYPDVSKHLTEHGAHILIAPHASPFEMDKSNTRETHAQKRAPENNIPILFVNQVGGQDELVFDGGAFALNPNAASPQNDHIFRSETFTETPLTVDAVLAESKTISVNATNHIKTQHANPLSDVYKALKLGISDYVSKNKFPGVLIGLSGGVDSALVATLAADALGPDAVDCVMMPSAYTSQNSLDDASDLAKNLGVSLQNIPINAPVDLFDTLVKNNTPTTETIPTVTFENIQSRTRAVLLMALSNATGKMVLSTGNKSEMAVGYATLYGDMCGGFNPLKDVYKTLVYDLCHWRNQQGHVIPENILSKAPTAELKANQTDQDSLPPYDILDEILRYLIEDEKSISNIVSLGHDHNTVSKIQHMLSRAEYKRRQAPPGVKITTRAFGRDRRYPITNGFIDPAIQIL